MNEALHSVFRPNKFSEVVGQSPVVKALQTIIKKGGSQAFLFSGPSGTGKTTLARIVARELGCKGTGDSILELDGATYTGVESMK